MFERILLTGGTGKTGSRIERRLRARGVEPKVVSRLAGQGRIHFDWAVPSTFADALSDVQSVYLVAPPAPDPLAAMQPFLEQALSIGVSRFVLLSSSALEEGGPMLGQVHQFLNGNASSSIVLRPTWFMQNFSELQHRNTIVQEGRIYSATEDGQIPFIDADNIAAVAVEALLDEALPNSAPILTGPALLTYDQVAATIADVAGYPVEHFRLSEEALAEHLANNGVPAAYCHFLASLDTQIANGIEARLTPKVQEISGEPPRSFKDSAVDAKAHWIR